MKFHPLFLLPLCLGLRVTTAKADIVWETNYDTARAKSQATGKPLFIDVYTDWCGWCKRLDSNVYPDPRVQQMSRQFVMVKLNAEGGGAAFAQSMRITGYPTLIFASSRGEQLSRIAYVEPNDFLAIMSDSLRRNGPARPQRVAKTRRTAKSQTSARRLKLAPGARNWKKQPELNRAVNRTNYQGAFLLNEDGIVALDQPVAKTKKSAKVRR